MEYLVRILSSYYSMLACGLCFALLGLAIPKYRLYFLIAGLNGLSAGELQKYQLRFIEKYFGRFLFVLGCLVILNPLFWSWIGQEALIGTSFLVLVISFVAALFVFGALHRKKIAPPQDKMN